MIALKMRDYRRYSEISAQILNILEKFIVYAVIRKFEQQIIGAVQAEIINRFAPSDAAVIKHLAAEHNIRQGSAVGSGFKLTESIADPCAVFIKPIA